MISLFGFCVLHPQVRSAKPSWFDSDGSARSWRSAFYKRRCRMSQHERRRFEHWNCWPLRRSSHPYVRQRGVESLHEDLQHWCQLWPWAWKWNCIQNHPKSDVMCHTVSIEIIPSCVENTDLLDFWFSGDLKILKVVAMPTFTSFFSNRTADSCKCDERLGLTWSVAVTWRCRPVREMLINSVLLPVAQVLLVFSSCQEVQGQVSTCGNLAAHCRLQTLEVLSTWKLQ